MQPIQWLLNNKIEYYICNVCLQTLELLQLCNTVSSSYLQQLADDWNLQFHSYNSRPTDSLFLSQLSQTSPCVVTLNVQIHLYKHSSASTAEGRKKLIFSEHIYSKHSLQTIPIQERFHSSFNHWYSEKDAGSKSGSNQRRPSTLSRK